MTGYVSAVVTLTDDDDEAFELPGADVMATPAFDEATNTSRHAAHSSVEPRAILKKRQRSAAVYLPYLRK